MIFVVIWSSFWMSVLIMGIIIWWPVEGKHDGTRRIQPSTHRVCVRTGAPIVSGRNGGCDYRIDKGTPTHRAKGRHRATTLHSYDVRTPGSGE
jgi:hypothetical protein